MTQAILSPSRFGLAEFKRQDWVATAEEGIKPEDLLEPAYWAHVSEQMQPFAHVEVRAEDGSWIAELVVLGCDRNWARVHMLNKYMLTNTDVSLTQAIKHEIKWKGPHRKWSVIRLSDNEIIKDQIDDKVQAELWTREHEKVT